MIIKVIYANTWEELTGKMIGYYHDHCYHLYTGTIGNVPEKFQEIVANNKNYVFIYEEDEPIKY